MTRIPMAYGHLRGHERLIMMTGGREDIYENGAGQLASRTDADRRPEDLRNDRDLYSDGQMVDIGELRARSVEGLFDSLQRAATKLERAASAFGESKRMKDGSWSERSDELRAAQADYSALNRVVCIMVNRALDAETDLDRLKIVGGANV